MGRSRLFPAKRPGHRERAHTLRQARRREVLLGGCLLQRMRRWALLRPLRRGEKLIMRNRHNTRSVIGARTARCANAQSPEPAEARLWSAINAGQLDVAFCCPVVVAGRYIVDFFASGVGLVVEVDGGYHTRRARADARRDEALRRAGLTVLRLPAELVLGDFAGGGAAGAGGDRQVAVMAALRACITVVPWARS